MRMKLLGSAAAVTCMMLASPAHANYIQSLGNDENCVAVGGACVAREGDLGSYASNPAAIADFDRARIGMNLRFIDTRSLDLIDSGGNHDIPKTNTKGSIAVSPTLVGYIPLARNVTFGLGIGAPFAITADWGNADGIHRYNMSDQALFVLDVQPTIGVKINDRLQVGAGVSVTAFKHLRTETLIPQSFGAALPPALGGLGTVIPTGPNDPVIGSITLNTNRDFGIGLPPDNLQAEFGEAALVLGARFKVNDLLTLGLSGRTRTKTTFKGTVQLVVGNTTQVAPFSLRLDMPGHVQAGLAVSLPTGTIASFDAQRTFWSDAVGFGSPARIEFGSPLLGFINRLEVNYRARDTWTWRMGLSQKLSTRLEGRVGLALDQSIFDNRHVDVLTYDSNRTIWSAGLRYDARKGDAKQGFILTGSVQLTDYHRRTIATGESQNLGGVSLPVLTAADTLSFGPNRSPFTYDGLIKAFSLGIQYAF